MYAFQTGKYIKKNKEVWISAAFELTSKDNSMSGEIEISGLPFAVAEISPGVSYGYVSLIYLLRVYN